MIYRAPFYAITKAIYQTLKTSDIGLEWFDSSTPIEEIEQLFKNQEEFSYGVFGNSDADCLTNKDTAIWDASIRLDVYSNYKGRKVISQKLEAVLNYLCTDKGWNGLQSSFVADGYQLISIDVGRLVINAPFYGDIGVWQSGSINVMFKVGQLDEEE